MGFPTVTAYPGSGTEWRWSEGLSRTTSTIQGSTNVFDEPDDMPYLDSKNRMHYRYLSPVPVFPGLEAEAAAEQVAQD